MSLSFSRNNPNIEDPTVGDDKDSNPDVNIIPVPPDQDVPAPIEEPPDQPGKPENQPNPPPMGDPKPNEPTRLV